MFAFAAVSNADGERAWLVWSHEHGAWWKPNDLGYTTNVAEAGRYSLHEAMKRCSTRSARPDGAPNEIASPSPEWVAQQLPSRSSD